MVKKMITRLSVLAVLIAFLSACSKQAEYTNVIPADATGIVSIDLKALGQKAGVNDKENEGMKQKALEALKSGTNAAVFEQIEKIIKDPSESGFDLQSPIYLFTSPTLPCGLVMKVSSEDKLKATIGLAVKEQLCEPIATGDGYSYIAMNGTMLAFSPTSAIALEVRGSQIESAKTTIAGFMKQTADNSMAKNKGFQKMLERKGDFTFFASMEAIPPVYARQISMALPKEYAMKDIMILGDLSFENGKIVSHYENYTENEALKEKMAIQQKAIQKIGGTYVKNFPASTLAYISLGANGEELYKVLMENKEFQDNVSLAKADEIKNLFAAFKGDISIGLLDVSMSSNAPSFVAYAELKNTDVLKMIYEKKAELGLSSREDIVKLNENEYVFQSRDMRIFFGAKDKNMYITNNEMVYKNLLKAEDKNIKETEFAKDIDDKSFFMAINMQAILELPAVKMIMGFGGEEVKMYHQIASEVSFFEINATNDGTSEIVLSLKNKDTNALKLMVDMGRQFAGM